MMLSWGRHVYLILFIVPEARCHRLEALALVRVHGLHIGIRAIGIPCGSSQQQNLCTSLSLRAAIPHPTDPATMLVQL
jgi:hypothetical protein